MNRADDRGACGGRGVGTVGRAPSKRPTKRVSARSHRNRGHAGPRGGAVEPLEGRTLLAAVLGGQLFSLGGPVQVEVLPAGGEFTSELRLFGTSFDERGSSRSTRTSARW
jgi:hypothetical protein